MRKKRLTILLLILLSLAIYGYVQYKRALDYEATVKDVRFDTIGIRRTNGELLLNITNKSDFSLTVTDCKLDMYVNGVLVSKLDTAKNIVIKGNSDFDVPLKFDIEPHRILSIKNIFALKGIANPDVATLGFKGYVVAEKGLFVKKILVDIVKPFSWYL